MASGKELKAVISLAGKVDGSLKSAVKQAESMTKGLNSKFAQGAVKAAGVAGKALAGTAAAAGTALVAVGAAAVKNYAQYEQLAGGIETLFGESADTIKQYADQAYMTAGVSANSYMEQATAFSASLTQSLGGDTQKAAQYADLAIKDMSDNANKMGTSIDSIQQTYQSLMRGNFSMLDNLKLGYGGTKAELERLVKDASELTGKALDPSKFSDVIEAIHAVQENMGITGTTAKEAATTIEGSINTAKAAWDNWLTGLARSDADMGQLTDNLLTAVGNVAKNLMPVIGQVAQSLVKEIPNAIAGAWNGLGSLLGDTLGLTLPNIDASQVQAALQPVYDIVSNLMPLIGSLANAVLPALAAILGPVITLVLQIVNAALPPLTAAIQAVTPIIQNIVSAIMPPLVSLFQTLAPVIAQVATFIGSLLVAAIQVLSPIISALTPVVSAVFNIFNSLLQTVLIPILSPLMQIGQTLLPPLAGLFSALQGPVQIVTGVFQGFLGVVQGIVNFLGQLISKVGEAAQALANSPVGQFVGGIFGFAKGGFTSGPALAGEDPRYPTEAVISFNPAYRAQNLRYWAMAGHMLGARSGGSSSTSSSGGGGSISYDLSGMTFSPNVIVRGNASKDDIVAAIMQCEGDFMDFVMDALARREEAAYV